MLQKNFHLSRYLYALGTISVLTFYFGINLFYLIIGIFANHLMIPLALKIFSLQRKWVGYGVILLKIILLILLLMGSISLLKIPLAQVIAIYFLMTAVLLLSLKWRNG